MCRSTVSRPALSCERKPWTTDILSRIASGTAFPTMFASVCDRRRIDGRPGLELPQRLPGVLIERDELAVEQSREQKAAVGRQHSGRARRLNERDLPFFLAAQRVCRSV